ncbi:ABC transporter ATP-binding protein [soil metagenome]
MIQLVSLTKRFPGTIAVDDISLSIHVGEFVTLLGPSGCGKTTILRCISGFEKPDSGAVMLDGQDVTYEPPYRRDVNQVFQSYALFPHLNVEDNIAFGLRMKRVARRERTQRIAEAIDWVALRGLEKRRPSQLSGGQMQRVALARAIVNKPRVLLLDEPLAALDAKLRRAMQIELKQLQRRLGMTFVFVTHEQEEALILSDRIAVMNAGRVEQFGNSADVYHRPLTPFVASFIGQTNLIEATVARAGNPTLLRAANGFELEIATDQPLREAETALIMIRPEKIRLLRMDEAAAGRNAFAGEIVERIFRGETSQLLVRTEFGQQLHVVQSGSSDALHAARAVRCQFDARDVVVVRTR